MQEALVVEATTDALEELVAALGGQETGNRSDQIPAIHGLLPALADGLEEANRRSIGNIERIRQASLRD